MQDLPNPYSFGSPVFGEKFYGRAKELNEMFDLSDPLKLFLSTRRMGKSSLLHEFKYICQNEQTYNSNLCIIWELDGKKTISQALKNLFCYRTRALLTKVAWDTVEKCQRVHDVVELFCSAYWGNSEQKTIWLLIDEPMSILKQLSEQEQDDFLMDVTATFEEGFPNLKVVIVSTPQLIEFMADHPGFLQSFRRLAIQQFSKQEAEDLIRLTKSKSPDVQLKFLNIDSELINRIWEDSNRVPCYIQYMCYWIFENFPDKTPLQTLDEIAERQAFADYFRSDFKVLNPLQKMMVLKLARSGSPLNSGELKAIDIPPEVGIPTQTSIHQLLDLGMLKKTDGDTYRLANKLFERWIRHDFENLEWQTKQQIEAQKGSPVKKKENLVSRLQQRNLLFQKIVDFLLALPCADTPEGRRTLVVSAQLDMNLANQIHCDTTAIEFFQCLVQTLFKYGKLEDGRNSLEAILETAKQYIGIDKQEECDQLILELQNLSQIGT